MSATHSPGVFYMEGPWCRQHTHQVSLTWRVLGVGNTLTSHLCLLHGGSLVSATHSPGVFYMEGPWCQQDTHCRQDTHLVSFTWRVLGVGNTLTVGKTLTWCLLHGGSLVSATHSPGVFYKEGPWCRQHTHLSPVSFALRVLGVGNTLTSQLVSFTRRVLGVGNTLTSHLVSFTWRVLGVGKTLTSQLVSFTWRVLGVGNTLTCVFYMEGPWCRQHTHLSPVSLHGGSLVSARQQPGFLDSL